MPVAPLQFFLIGRVDGLHRRPAPAFRGIGQFHGLAAVCARALGKRRLERIAARMGGKETLQCVVVFEFFKIVNDARCRIVGYGRLVICLRRKGRARIGQSDILSVLRLHGKDAHVIPGGIPKSRAEGDRRPCGALFRRHRRKICRFGKLHEVLFRVPSSVQQMRGLTSSSVESSAGAVISNCPSGTPNVSTSTFGVLVPPQAESNMTDASRKARSGRP